ncbi:MAG: flagellar hook-associated protein FlgK [Deltaproteobacteria bacterium]|nr:flagellar hook-associated protein FlgK [Deltaproteobacteria bacterium]
MADFNVFETAISALNANAKALSVASQNIANANTPGYSRQRVVIQSNESQIVGGIEIGRGASVTSVERVVDNFAELRLRDTSSTQSESKVTSDSIAQAGTLFNELSSDGLSTYLSNFFSSFQDVANDPQASGARQDLLSKASIMVDRFHSLSQGLKDIRTSLDTQIKDNVDKINTLAQDIYKLNQKINDAPDALTLKDERNAKVQELSGLTDVSTVENGSGTFQVYIANGMLLVNDTGTATLSTLPNAGNAGLSDINFTPSPGAASTNISSRFQTGAIKGLMDVRDTNIPAYQSNLDELAYRLSGAVNTLHTTGYDLDGNHNQRFFTNLASSTDAAASIALDPVVDGHPRAIAASGSSGGVPGGNDMALQLSALSSSNVAFGSGSTTFGAFYGNLLAQVGSDGKSAQSNAQFSDDVFQQAQAQRDQISGVSMDEEQTNLLKYQAAFQAASRLVSIASTLFDTLINLGK